MQTVEIQARIAAWRDKQRNGTLTMEDMKEAVIALRGDRSTAAAAVKPRSAAKAKAPARSVDSLLDELENF